MVAFYPTRETRVTRRSNKYLNFGNVVVESETTGDGDHDSSSGIGRKLEFWYCGGENLKRNCSKRAEEKLNNKKDDVGANNKRDEVTGGGTAPRYVHY